VKFQKHKPMPIFGYGKTQMIITSFSSIGKSKEMAFEISKYLESRPYLNAIYIAAPLEEIDFINNIRSELEAKYAIFTGSSLQEALKSSFPKCQLMNENFHDIFSHSLKYPLK